MGMNYWIALECNKLYISLYLKKSIYLTCPLALKLDEKASLGPSFGVPSSLAPTEPQRHVGDPQRDPQPGAF